MYTCMDKRDVKGGTNGHGTKRKVCVMFRCPKTGEKNITHIMVYTCMDVKSGTNGHGTKRKVCYMLISLKTREKSVWLSFMFKRSIFVFQML